MHTTFFLVGTGEVSDLFVGSSVLLCETKDSVTNDTLQ